MPYQNFGSRKTHHCKGGTTDFIQDKELVALKEKESGDVILRGEVTPQDTANVYLKKMVPKHKLKNFLQFSGYDRDQLHLVHRQWGHLSFDKCRDIMGLPKSKNAVEDTCNDCWKAELKEPNRNKETLTRADLHLYRIHMDLTGVKASNM